MMFTLLLNDLWRLNVFSLSLSYVFLDNSPITSFGSFSATIELSRTTATSTIYQPKTHIKGRYWLY